MTGCGDDQEGVSEAQFVKRADTVCKRHDSVISAAAAKVLAANDAGQDIHSQLVWGARSAVLVALPAAALAVAVGVLVGAGARMLSGWAEVTIMRVVDACLAVPALPLLTSWRR